MKILVCGGREFADTYMMDSVLTRYYMEAPTINDKVDFMIVNGGARGADKMSTRWAEFRSLPVIEYPADWEKYGRSAGPIRNKQMLDVAKPDLVLAFPGGKGTANMIKQARAAGVPVVEIY